jgi:hypothetical protein
MRIGHESSLKFFRYGGATDDPKSLTILIHDKNDHNILEAFCTPNGDWRVIMSTSEGKDTEMSWEDFLEMVYQLSLLVADENRAMLRENHTKIE